MRRVRHDPTLSPSTLDNFQLDLLDGDGVVVDPQDAGGLAGGGAEPAGEVREVVGGVQPLDRLPPVAAIYEVVPVGDDVVERAALVTEGDAAVHTTGGLLLEMVFGDLLVALQPVVDALLHGAARGRLPPELHEAAWFSHRRPLPCRRLRGRAAALPGRGGSPGALPSRTSSRPRANREAAPRPPCCPRTPGAAPSAPAPGPGLPAPPAAPGRSSACCSASRSRRPRRRRRRCRRSCRRRSCGRSGQGRPRGRRSCTRSNGRRRLR